MGSMPSESYSILFEKTRTCEMLMNFRNFLFLKRIFMRSLSARTPSRLFGFFTSTNARGIPFISSVTSGRNSSSPFLQVNSVTTWNELLSKFLKSISLVPEVAVSILKNTCPKSSLSRAKETLSKTRFISPLSRSGLMREILSSKISLKILVLSSQIALDSEI